MAHHSSETVYTCQNCDNGKEMNYIEAKFHVLEFHGVSLNATKEMLFDVAKEPRHLSICELKFDKGIILHEIKS